MSKKKLKLQTKGIFRVRKNFRDGNKTFKFRSIQSKGNEVWTYQVHVSVFFDT